MAQVGQCPVEPHKLQPPGATPGPATCSRVRNLEKRPDQPSVGAREPGDSVGSIPGTAAIAVVAATQLIPWSNRDDTCLTCRERRFNSGTDAQRWSGITGVGL